MSKFILRKDWIVKYSILGQSHEELLYKKGEVFTPNEKGNYVFNTPYYGTLTMKYQDMKSATDNDELLFEEVVEKIKEIKITILDEEYENIERYFRLQLDVKTTPKKAKEIENYLRKTLQEML